jgi:hypothetical protein
VSRAVPMIATSLMLAKLACNPPHLALGVRQHAPIVLSFLHFVRRPRLREAFLEVLERVGAHGTSLTAEDDESHRTIERRDFRCCERARDFFRKTKPGHTATLAIALLDVVVDLDIAVADRHLIGQTIEALPNLERNEPLPVHTEPG